MSDQTEPTPKKRRGFACMDRARVSEIARKGGIAAHATGTAHEWNSEAARAAGSKGGKVTAAKKAAGPVAEPSDG